MKIQNLIGDKKTRFSWSVKQFEYEIVNQIFGVKEFVDSCASSSSYFSFFNFFFYFLKNKSFHLQLKASQKWRHQQSGLLKQHTKAGTRWGTGKESPWAWPPWRLSLTSYLK